VLTDVKANNGELDSTCNLVKMGAGEGLTVCIKRHMLQVFVRNFDIMPSSRGVFRCVVLLPNLLQKCKNLSVFI